VLAQAVAPAEPGFSWRTHSSVQPRYSCRGNFASMRTGATGRSGRHRLTNIQGSARTLKGFIPFSGLVPFQIRRIGLVARSITLPMR
jgi:hypothetical protein